MGAPEWVPQTKMSRPVSVKRGTHLTSSGCRELRDDIKKMCESLFRRLSITKLIVPRSVSRHGLCAIDLPRESPGYRDLFTVDRQQALSHGFPQHDRTFHFGRCQ